MSAGAGLLPEGALVVMAEVALAVGSVFAVADDILALAMVAVKDLNHYAQGSPSPSQQP